MSSSGWKWGEIMNLDLYYVGIRRDNVRRNNVRRNNVRRDNMTQQNYVLGNFTNVGSSWINKLLYLYMSIFHHN